MDEEVIVLDTDKLNIINYWQGDYSIEELHECTKRQFDNYIDNEDMSDYVDIFYRQYDESVKLTYGETDASIRSLLNGVLQDYLDFLVDLIDKTLTITFVEYDIENISQHVLQLGVLDIYRYFILQANDNFINVIGKDILSRNPHIAFLGGESFYKQYDELLTLYDPTIEAVDCMQFLELTDNSYMIKRLYNEGVIAGNFLRKYSPSLYKNESLKADIIVYIMTHTVLGEEQENGK